MTLAQHNRYDYAPITDRAAFAWPKGKGLAVYLGINPVSYTHLTLPTSDLV